MKFKKKFISIIQILFSYLLGCPKCFSIWTTLFLTGNVVMACLVGLSVGVLKELQNRIKIRL